MVKEPHDDSRRHAFISYVREDRAQVDRLQGLLESAGIKVWRDTENLWPGQDWKLEIRRAIMHESLAFIACFSENTERRETSYQNEELTLAVEQMRLRRPERPWLLPIRFDDCRLPEFDLGGGRTLDSLQRADLFGPSSAGETARLIAAIRQILGDHRTASDTTSAASPALGERVILATGYGDEDIGRKADELAERLPEALAPLARIAYNYRWSWHPAGEDLFRSIDAARWQLCEKNPVRLLQEASGIALARASGDRELLAAVTSLEHAIAADLTRPPEGSVAPQRPIAMMCAEYGVHQSLPNYFGGLGGLAGDFLKEASDRALPLVAVGLMYGQRFRQRLEVSGWQQESWTEIDPEQLPAALVGGPDGEPLTITVPIRGPAREGRSTYRSDVTAQIWRVAVGRVPLFLLDADLPQNGLLERWITSQLHVANQMTRLALKQAISGVRGWFTVLGSTG